MPENLPTFDDDDWVDAPKVVAEKLDLAPITLLRMRQEPDCGGLPYVRLSANRVGYMRRDQRAFLAARRVASQPEAGSAGPEAA